MNRHRFFKQRRHDLLYALILLVRLVVAILPRKVGLPLFGLAGRLIFACGGRDRRRTIDHLRFIYGDHWPEKRISKTARAVYGNLGKNLFDSVKLPQLSDEAFFRIVRHNPLDEAFKARDAGRGFVMITAHLGCFEMLLPFFVRRGIPSFAVGRRMFDPRIEQLIVQHRNGPNMEYVSRAENPREVIRRLRKGMAFGTLIDQDTAVEGVFAHFLGKPAYTPSSAIRFAMRYDIPLFVITTARQPDDTHQVTLNGPVSLHREGDVTANLVRNVERINGFLSEAIEANPEQWVWMHRRWHHTPTSPGLGDVAHIERLPSSNS